LYSSQTHFQDGAYSVVGLLTLRHCTKEELKKAPLKTPKKMMIRIVKAMIKASESDDQTDPKTQSPTIKKRKGI